MPNYSLDFVMETCMQLCDSIGNIVAIGSLADNGQGVYQIRGEEEGVYYQLSLPQFQDHITLLCLIKGVIRVALNRQLGELEEQLTDEIRKQLTLMRVPPPGKPSAPCPNETNFVSAE